MGREKTDKKTDHEWYCLLREAQGDLTAWTQKGLKFMINSEGFIHDSLFCEYAYIINLDDGLLEFYQGFNKNPEAPGRYADYQDNGYCGVALVDTIALDDIFQYSPMHIQGIVEKWEKMTE